ncbi:MAG: ATP-binding protein, partial [Bacteroidota bacterium]
MKYFSTNLSGRVRNFSLPKNRPLIPLYEAIVNSINAIEERHKSDSNFILGKISIEILRQRTLFDESDTTTVEGFVITDNGIGFTEANMQSFMESDSAYKAEIGGKGVGRFAWLKAFSKVDISSIYSENGVFQKREFEFSIEKQGIEDKLEECPNATDNKTVVTLSSYIKDYERYVPKQIDTIAMRIVQHCLVYFISEHCPEIVIFDSNDSLSLNALFREKFKTEDNVSHISVEGIDFELLNVKIEDRAFNNGNRLYLCANGRLVDSRDLEGYIVDLDKQIYERNGFWYLGVLTSKYFDNNVDMNRLSFSIPETSGPLHLDISMDQIIKEVCNDVRQYLAEYLAQIKAEKDKRIVDFTTDKAPQYRHLLHYMASDIEAIKPGITDEKLEDELFFLKRKFENETKTECNGLMEKLKNGAITSDEYQLAFEKEIKKISDANRAALADYIVHRR